MSYFIVGLTNISPTPNAPLTAAYTQCGQWPRVSYSEQDLTVACTPGLGTFRYVIIRTGTADFINFCEVQVFGTSEPIVNVGVVVAFPSLTIKKMTYLLRIELIPE